MSRSDVRSNLIKLWSGSWIVRWWWLASKESVQNWQNINFLEMENLPWVTMVTKYLKSSLRLQTLPQVFGSTCYITLTARMFSHFRILDSCEIFTSFLTKSISQEDRWGIHLKTKINQSGTLTRERGVYLFEFYFLLLFLFIFSW